ncbi:hypothetical protein [Acidipila rosea]|uniref:Uncharacterized protein n=1 Tax=Acidipila rosea TaxID=768535 RepID=A0A4R1KXS2_9BACT|nr:hypothetical protein [Acidipila rosea]MBW4028528.1 hypothetical protein [Acidobacteriota bacterium]TCK70235.1 hypothetical protein C7378_3392 [Acidipila rosea]
MSGVAAQDIEADGTTMLSALIWFLVYAVLSLMAYATFMFTVTALLKTGVLPDVVIPPALILALSFSIPMLTGLLLTRMWPSHAATFTWIAGLIWFMIVGLWILDMPTAPGACFHCGASEKLWFTFFSLTQDSGMIQGQGRFIGTWPAAAMIGYSVGAKIAMRKQGASATSDAA